MHPTLKKTLSANLFLSCQTLHSLIFVLPEELSGIQLPITNNQRRHVFFFVNSEPESESQEVQINIFFLNCEDMDVIVHTLHPYMSAHAMNEHNWWDLCDAYAYPVQKSKV